MARSRAFPRFGLLRCVLFFSLSLILIGTRAAAQAQSASADQLRPGIWAASDPGAFPLPTSGFDVYFLGELHGTEENASIAMTYLERLAAEGLRDVAIEEDNIYERGAQAYVAGDAANPPYEACLRRPALDAIRAWNLSHPADEQIRVHLTDVDSPAATIGRHLKRVQAELVQAEIAGAEDVAIPEPRQVKQTGYAAVDALATMTQDPRLSGELRTIRHSIGVLRAGLEVGIGQPRGSPYQEDREAAIAENIADIVAAPDAHGVLVLYGADHASKTTRSDGGPEHDLQLEMTAQRLEQAGLSVYSIFSLPLSGIARWRGQTSIMYWSPGDVTAEDGATFADLEVDFDAEAGQPKFFFIDRRANHATMPTSDLTRMRSEAALFYDPATPMRNRCAP